MSHDIVWSTITHNLPALVEPLKRILATVPECRFVNGEATLQCILTLIGIG